ncbi:MAG TPA: hypothetical protein VGH37_10445 [Candidatus Acidoferrum sp.]|jgi:hypothetical protein
MRNPIRGTVALDLKLDDFDWFEPKKRRKPRKTDTEILNRHRDNVRAKLRRLDAHFVEAEIRILKRRARLIADEIELDAMKQRLDDERADRKRQLETELETIQKYYANENQKQLDKEDKARRDYAAKLLKEINADRCKNERELFRRRGVIR